MGPKTEDYFAVLQQKENGDFLLSSKLSQKGIARLITELVYLWVSFGHRRATLVPLRGPASAAMQRGLFRRIAAAEKDRLFGVGSAASNALQRRSEQPKPGYPTWTTAPQRFEGSGSREGALGGTGAAPISIGEKNRRAIL